MIDTLIAFIIVSVLMMIFTKVLQVICKPGLRTSAISIKSHDNKCIVRVEKTRMRG
ncbi:MAG: hypothetical protein WC471_05710 [Candidatus Woesearchaeota archaeon]|jgi:hypothetical protein